MSLANGVLLGPYEIVAPLGAGGMGEVYRARDTRLDRTVAVKVLPESLAGDPQFRERFNREARAISQLSHPNICTLHDVGEHAGTAFLVMEFLEGETLANRLARAAAKGAGLPVQEALSIAIQIADALTTAHRAGVVHRDLKPGNVMLTRSGAKLLDFGLAKAALPAVAPGGLSGMETTPPQTLTAHGTILGTLHYMAPEQVEGHEADARSDIFAFGCVLYEMFTGQKAFEGKSPASLVASILEREPAPVTKRQPLASSLVDAIVRKCLVKAPDDRWQSAADLASALRWAADNITGAVVGANGLAATGHVPSRRRAWVAAVLATALIAFAVGALTWRYVSSTAAPAGAIRFEVFPPADAMFAPAPIAAAAQLALSPDGQRLAYVASPRHGASRLWIRAVDALDAQSLPDTQGASFPFWSPDGRFLAFFAGDKLKKVDVSGGGSQPLADVVIGRGGTWSPDGTIVFGGVSYSPLSQVSAAGGPVKPATVLDASQGAIAHYWPQFLPDGRHFLYYQRSSNPEYDGIYLASLDSSTTTRIHLTQTRALYSLGHLLFVRDGMLLAQPFDLRSHQTSGEPVRVGDNVGYFQSSFGYAAITASSTGALAYGPTVAPTTTLQWYDRGGKSTGSPTVPGVYTGPRLSPDQKMIVMSVRETGSWNGDIWVLDLARGTSSRSTFDPANEWFPIWSADGARMFFGSTRSGATNTFVKVGVGKETPLLENSSIASYPSDASRDGRWLLYMQSNPGGYDLGTLPLSGEPKPTLFVATPFNEVQGRFSPNGRWVAYASDESGKFEVYVRPFPAANGQWKISVAGGMQPEWRRDGQELFYVSNDGKLMAVPVTSDAATFNYGIPQALFDVEMPEASPPYPNHYAVMADGQRFLVNTVGDQPRRPALTVILNWAAELRK